MKEAAALDRSLGFKPIAPYNANPVAGTFLLTLDTYSHVLPTMQEATTQMLENCIMGRKKWLFEKFGRTTGRPNREGRPTRAS